MSTPLDSASSRVLERLKAVSSLIDAYSKSASMIQYEVTESCQNRCSFCYNSDRSDAVPVDLITVISSLLGQGIRIVSFTGGEPLLADGIFEAAKMVKARGSAALITNGRLIPEIDREDLLGCFNMFQVSLQSPDQGVHDTLCNSEGAFKDTTSGIQRLVSLGAVVGICTTLTAQNLSSLWEMPRFLRELGVRFWYVNRMCPPPPGRPDYGLHVAPALLRSTLEGLASACVARSLVFGVLSGVPSRLSLGSRILKNACRGCGMALQSGLTVRPDGAVSPCPPLNVSIGHYRDLGQASQTKAQVYSSLLQRVQGSCRACVSFPECGGGCRAAAYNYSGRWDGPDPFCAGKAIERRPANW